MKEEVFPMALVWDYSEWIKVFDVTESDLDCIMQQIIGEQRE